MQFKFWFVENDEYDRLLALYQQWEPLLVQSSQIQQELESNGTVRISTVQQVLGVSEGEANFATREFNKAHQNPEGQAQYWQRQQDQIAAENQDNYYYHITLRTRLRKIRRQGLRPRSEPVFSNYTGHAQGKIFLTEKGGVNFWKDWVGAHEQHNIDNPQGVVVLRIPKVAVVNVEEDKPGTQDSRHPSYHTTDSIPASNIEVVG